MFHPYIYKNSLKACSVLLLALFYITIPKTVLAQSTIKGTVVDDHGYPLKRAIVHLKGKKTGVATNKDGYFELPAMPGTVLVFVHPRYYTTEVKVKTNRPLLVHMSVRYLQETVAPAISTATNGDTIYLPDKPAPDLQVLYGRTNAWSFLGAISTIGAGELGTTPASSYTYALPGRLAGLNVIQTRGFYTPLTGSLTSRDIFVGNIPNNTSG